MAAAAGSEGRRDRLASGELGLADGCGTAASLERVRLVGEPASLCAVGVVSWTGRLAALALGDGDVRGTTCGGECDGERLGERDGERLGERDGERLGEREGERLSEGEGDASSSSLGESQSVEGTRRSSTATRRVIFLRARSRPENVSGRSRRSGWRSDGCRGES